MLTVKPVLSGHSKRRPKLVFKTDYPKGSIPQYFRPSLSCRLSLSSLFCLFLSGHLRQVLLYLSKVCMACTGSSQTCSTMGTGITTSVSSTLCSCSSCKSYKLRLVVEAASCSVWSTSASREPADERVFLLKNTYKPLMRQSQQVVCFSRLLKCLRSLYDKQCGSRSECSHRSSLFWVHAACFYT